MHFITSSETHTHEERRSGGHRLNFEARSDSWVILTYEGDSKNARGILHHRADVVRNERVLPQSRDKAEPELVVGARSQRRVSVERFCYALGYALARG